MSEVYISIQPQYTKLIKNKEKNYEFRKYYIKDLKTMYVYESVTSSLKYIMEVGSPICYPDKVEGDFIGNLEFNKGNDYKYAYPIIHLYELKSPITLTELRSKYQFAAPQKYTFVDKYEELHKRLKKEDTIKIF